MSERAFVRSPAVLSRTVADEVLVTTADADQVDRLSPTAAAVWGLLERPATVEALVSELARLFAAPPTTIARDVEGLMDDLIRRGWVEEVRHP
jgi:hypothetical protein